jgi:predicted short-subunit dehydrogenase-like oxidoreductase (DUF2520 family)
MSRPTEWEAWKECRASNKMENIGFIGAGTVGTALASRLSQKGYTVVAVSSRTLASARKLSEGVPECMVYQTAQEVAEAAEFVFITTPDDIIPTIAERVRWHKGQKVVHCSGADSLDILEPARLAGARVGCFHPLQTFAGVEQAVDNLPGTTFALEAEEPLLTTLKEMARSLEGDSVQLKAGDKVLYHAAAVFACNYVVTLVKLATDLWRGFGIPQDQATHAILPLLQGTVRNIGSVGLPNCLTGPIARGDSGTIRKHLRALETAAPDLMTTYAELALQTLPIAVAKGRIGEEKARELEGLLLKVRTSK